MSGQPDPADNQQPHSDDVDDVFVRIRRRIAEMRGTERGKLDPEALAKKLADRAKMLRGQLGKGEPAAPPISFLAFSHGQQRYGIPISDIVEVQPLTNYTPVPHAPRFIRGVVNWRGAIIALVDLMRLFGIVESGLVDERACVIVEAAGRRVGILACQAEELYTVPLNQVKAVPELPTEVPPEWVVGVHDENRLILSLKPMLQSLAMTDFQAPA